MTHAIFEMDFELAAREVEDRVGQEVTWGWRPPPDPALALRALRVMFQHSREGLLEWQEREKLRLRNFLGFCWQTSNWLQLKYKLVVAPN